MTEKNTLPVLSNEGSLANYLQQIKKFPMLTEKQEVSLANNGEMKVIPRPHIH